MMSDMLHRGQAWLAEKLSQHASRQIIYQRDDVSVELSATIGVSRYEQDDGEGVITRAQVRDYLVDTQALMLSAIGTLPRRGDQIIEQEANRTFIFEVMSLGSDPPWRYSDPFRIKLRIHTKQVESHS
jgi:hypothetical protein